MGSECTGATLIVPRVEDIHHGDVHVVGPPAVRADAALALGEDVAVEPQAVSRVVQVDGRQGRVIGNVEGHGHVEPLSAVRHS